MKYLWDLFFGAFLIGGAPWSILALSIVVGDLLQAHTHVAIPDAATGIILILAFSVFGAAVAYRIRKRLLPLGFIAVEFVLGVIGAFVLFMYYGVMVHFIID